jgi:transcriptional repressor NrdR
MFCPFCSCEDTKVVDKRDNGETGVTRRRRECINCKKRFTTYERIENIILNVTKRNGKVEEFDREKLKRAILKAVKKRAIPEKQIDELITEIEQKLMQSDKQEIPSTEIGEMVLRGLTRIDKLGALLFAAVYKELNTLEEVQAELERLAS